MMPGMIGWWHATRQSSLLIGLRKVACMVELQIVDRYFLGCMWGEIRKSFFVVRDGFIKALRGC